MADKAPLSDEAVREIILAAINAAGDSNDGDWSGRVTELATKITVMTNPDSDLAKTVQGVNQAKVFTGTVVSIVPEASSKRGLITLDTGTTMEREGLPAGQEQVRTDRTDSSKAAKNLANYINKHLIGHKVAVWVQVEEYKKSNGMTGKVRVLRHIEDLGEA